MEDWKALLHTSFPVVFDTKLLAMRAGMFDNALGPLYRRVTSAAFQPPPGAAAVTVNPSLADYAAAVRPTAIFPSSCWCKWPCA